MAQGKHEQELDELNTPFYLRKTPNATSGIQQSEDFRLNRPTSLEVPGNFKIMNNDFQQKLFGGCLMEELKQPDDQLLISAFADWNLGSRPEKEAFPFTNHISISKPEQHGGALFSLQPQTGDPHAFNVPNGAKTRLQNTENYFGAPRLMKDGMGFVSDPSFPADTQSSPPYSHRQHVNLNQSQFMWRNIEEEQLYKTPEQRNLYLLQQQNHHFDAPNVIHANLNMATGMMNKNQGHYLQSYKFPQWLVDHSSPSLPYEDLDSTRVLDKFSQQSCPGLVPVNQSLYGLVQNGRFILNGQVCYNSCNSDQDFLSLGNLRPTIGLSPYGNGLRGSDVGLLPRQHGCVNEVRGSIYHLAKDQNGCRYLQRKFSEGSPKEVAIIFGEVLEHISDLMTDPFGNYLIQKLLQVCDENQMSRILREITQRPGNLIRISCDMHGYFYA